jgi:hypothetical protein
MSEKVTREEIMELFFPKSPPPKPKPKPAEKLADAPIEVARRTAQQAVEQLAKREDEEAARWREQKSREQWLMHRQAQIDACWERQRAEREIEKSWRDPCGLWGRATLACPLDD